MRYFAIFVLAVAGAVVLSLLIPKSDFEQKELVISAYLAPDGYTPEDCGADTDYHFEQLESGTTRLLAPEGYPRDADGEPRYYNFNLKFEFDGAIVVSADDVQLSMGEGAEPFNYDVVSSTGRDFGYQFQLNDSGYLALFPIGGSGYYELDEKIGFYERTTTEFGHEYYIDVKAYNDIGDAAPVVSATLKLVKLKNNDAVTSFDGAPSGYFSIELIMDE